MIRLPDETGALRAYRPRAEPAPAVMRAARRDPLASRSVLAAAHVATAADTGTGGTDAAEGAIDWDATLAFRRHLWRHGLGVAEAMDTAQRGMGLSWPAAAELLTRSAAEARAVGGRIVCGVGTDQLPDPPTRYGRRAGSGIPGGGEGRAGTGRIRAAYEEQLAVVEDAGAQAVLMASRALAATARGPDAYLELYGGLLRQAARPVILHWLGPMFDPALRGYWGSDDLDTAAETFLRLVAAHPGKVDGVKVSLLDADREVALRRRLPEGVRCYTGDDLHYPELVAGDAHGFSHALLGVFDPLAPLAAEAVAALDAGDRAAFRAVLDPTVPLARHLFREPTRFYKTGVVLLAHLAGYQQRFRMLGGLRTARSPAHLARAYELADGLGLFPDPARAEARMRDLLADRGVR